MRGSPTVSIPSSSPTLSGEFAREQDITGDAIGFGLCHELGHMLAVFPGIANEFKADVFAFTECLPYLWKRAPDITDASEVHPEAARLPERVEADCARLPAEERFPCRRMVRAAISGNLFRLAFVPERWNRPSLDRQAGSDRREELQCKLDMDVAVTTQRPIPACADRRW